MCAKRIKNLAVFASGKGSNFTALLLASEKKKINGKIVLLVSNREDAGALETARAHGIDCCVMDEKRFRSAEEYAGELKRKLESCQTDYILLAGYLKMIPVSVIRAFRERILNIHPALLPKFGGKGMYGLKVHEAVLEAGEKETGVTIHFVDEEYDHGPMIMQKKVRVHKGDTPETLQKRVLKQEHKLYPLAVKRLCEDRISVAGGRVVVR